MKDNERGGLYVYPTPDDIVINEADFKLHLQDFGEANRNKISWRDILVFVPAWAVLLTADFKSVEFYWKINGPSLKGFYAALLVIGTLSHFKKISWHVKRFSFWFGKKIKGWFSKKVKTEDLKLSDYCKQLKHISDPIDKVEAIKSIIQYTQEKVNSKKGK